MANEEFGEKSELPTEHRRQEERQRGNVARSGELTIAVHLMATACILYGLGAGLVEAIARLVAKSISTAADRELSPSSFIAQLYDLAEWSASHVLPWLAALIVAGIAVNLAQVGFLISTEKMEINFNHLNPVTGMQRLFSMRSVVTLLLSLAKLGILLGVAAWFINAKLPLFLELATAPAGASFLVIGQSAVELSLWLASVLFVIGASDYGYQKWKYERELMMTKEEIKREMKDQEGDPLIRRRRQDNHKKMIQSRNVRRVSEADFLLVNPTHYSLAFKYAPPRYPAPTLIMKGVDEVALQMREVAKENDIPIIERPELARKLYASMERGQSIPPDLYDVFISILKYVYSITGKKFDMRGVETR